VVLLFEPLNRYEDHMVNTVAQAASLIAEAGSPGVRVLADTYHMSDSNRHQPGTGHVPFAAIVAALREIGFDGVVSVECRLRGAPADALPACGRYLRALLDA
jgi:sugar phosphate isomerase/epimerase